MARVMTKEGLERRIQVTQNKIAQLQEDLKYIQDNNLSVGDDNEGFTSE